MTGDVIGVLLADDHSVVRAGLKAVLSSARDINVVGEARNGKEAVDFARQLRPDVIVMDLTMPEMDGTAATKEIVATNVDSRVLVLTMHAEEDYLVPVMEAEASGYLVKSDPDRELANAIRAVAHGDVHLRPAGGSVLAKKLGKKPVGGTDRQRYEKLTDRERDVLRLVGQGYSAPEIGTRLKISPKTVDTYKQRIQEKLNFSHRSQYIQFALKLGLLTPDGA
jgi:two-component system, NarL family, response regulator NreC